MTTGHGFAAPMIGPTTFFSSFEATALVDAGQVLEADGVRIDGGFLWAEINWGKCWVNSSIHRVEEIDIRKSKPYTH